MPLTRFPTSILNPTSCVLSLLRLHVLLLGTTRRGSDASPRCTCTKATGRMRGSRKAGAEPGGGPAIQLACCRERSGVRLE